MQLPDITFNGNNVMSSFPLNVGVGISMTLRTDDVLSLYVNFLPFTLYFLFKYLNVNKPIGKSYVVSKLRKVAFPQVQFPISGTVEKISGRSKMTAVYVFNLDNEISINNNTYKYILLEPKNNTLIDSAPGSQICGLRLCSNPDLPYKESENRFMDWVTLVRK
jgi:hypothetical protein